MRHLRLALAACLLGPAIPAQEVRWQIPSPPSDSYLGPITPFVDYDGDGYRDLLHVVILNYGIIGQQTVALEILSGADGTALRTLIQGVLFRAAYAGDMNGDMQPDVALLQNGTGVPGQRAIQIYSLATNTVLWQQFGTHSGNYGYAMLGNLDVNGDGLDDFVATTSDASDSRVFVYDNSGSVRFVLQISGVYGVALSLAAMGDLNGDSGDDFVVGINDFSTRGTILLVSGRTGAILRTSQGLLPGDKTCDFVSNMGDMDGDGVADYAGFPWLSASRAIVPVFSGQTGQVIRTWNEFANSVVTGEDVDQDGVPDLVIGADWQVTTSPPHRYGRTRAYSGRDGTELWHVNNLPVFSNPTGSNGGGGWMEYAVGLGPQPGNPYPRIAWYDQNWILAGTHSGRIRGFRTNLAGQGPVTGGACSTTPELPLIGVRQIPALTGPFATHTRITVAKGPAGAGAWLHLGHARAARFGGLPLPIALDPYGLPGCELHVAPTASIFRVLGTTGLDSGYAEATVPRPLSTSTLGVAIAAQWLVFDPLTFAYAATQKHQLWIQ